MHTISHSMQCIAAEVTSSDTLVRVRWEFAGIVQGVGFRPRIYRLALAEGLAGWAANSTAGVDLEVEGSAEAVERFARGLQLRPALARVAAVRRRELAATGEAGFAFRPSTRRPDLTGHIAPDTAPCSQCRGDYHDPANRWFKYQFTNRTACEPNYTITTALPNDRPQTTMAGFVQCARCQREYEQPSDRRFHAQPNACPQCAPQLSRSLEEVARRLLEGEIVALKSVGGYQLLCDAANAAAVERLRGRKRRGRKPFALLARDRAAVEAVATVSEDEGAVLASAARPILLLDRHAGAQAEVAEAVAPGQMRLGVTFRPVRRMTSCLPAGRRRGWWRPAAMLRIFPWRPAPRRRKRNWTALPMPSAITTGHPGALRRFGRVRAAGDGAAGAAGAWVRARAHLDGDSRDGDHRYGGTRAQPRRRRGVGGGRGDEEHLSYPRASPPTMGAWRWGKRPWPGR